MVNRMLPINIQVVWSSSGVRPSPGWSIVSALLNLWHPLLTTRYLCQVFCVIRTGKGILSWCLYGLKDAQITSHILLPELGHSDTTVYAATAAKSLQLCPTLCDPVDGSPSGSPVPGILQARTLEWVAISFFNAWKWKVKVKSLSRVRLLTTPWTAAYQAPPPMGFSRQEYWSGVPLSSPTTVYRD